jgi:hypothetical protein
VNASRTLLSQPRAPRAVPVGPTHDRQTPSHAHPALSVVEAAIDARLGADEQHPFARRIRTHHAGDLAARRIAIDRLECSPAVSAAEQERKRKCIEQGGRSGCRSVPSMVHNDGLPPLVTKCPLAEIRRAIGLSTRYVIMIRKGLGIQLQETISILVAKRSKVSIGLN